MSFDEDSYRLAGSWQFTDNVMLYLGYTEGFNSGGLAIYSDSLGPVESQYDPELIENSEIGIRSDLFDGRLRFNATYFDTDWIDIQLLATVKDRQTGQEVTELVLQNSASANANGVELELTFAATDNLLLNANLGARRPGRRPAIALTREIFRDGAVRGETFAAAVELFGRQGTVEIAHS